MQVEVFGTLANIIVSKNVFTPTLCKDTVPILLGLARAIGRYAVKEPPLLCRMYYPIPEKPMMKTTNLEQALLKDSQKFSPNSSPNFRSIIPRLMSGSLNIDSIEGKKDQLHQLHRLEKATRLQTRNCSLLLSSLRSNAILLHQIWIELQSISQHEILRGGQ